MCIILAKLARSVAPVRTLGPLFEHPEAKPTLLGLWPVPFVVLERVEAGRGIKFHHLRIHVL